MKSHATAMIKCIDQPPGPTFFLPQGTKETSVQLLTKEPGIHLTGLTLWGMQDLVGEHLGNNGCDIVVKNNSQK